MYYIYTCVYAYIYIYIHTYIIHHLWLNEYSISAGASPPKCKPPKSGFLAAPHGSWA